ncbi:MAG TPA: nucleotide exchange factor GrpE, partial [Candidatus Moranbacteria bacterium]|nr:nucleotide exchange factor GrpE [Candidatus Moranbacteria bacterium]
DENIHEIVRGKAGKGKLVVKKILSKGYKIADRVIRPARVEV